MNWPWLLLLLFLFCLAGLVLLQRRKFIRDLQSLERLSYTLELGDRAPAGASLWLAEEYVAAGVIRVDSAQAAASRNLYRHASLPVVGLHDDVTEDIRLYSFVAESGVLLTTNVADAKVRLLGFARQQVRLVQFRPRGALSALHGQHRGTVQAWLQAGRRFEPVAPEDVAALLQREVEQLTDELRRQPPGPWALVVAVLADRYPRLLRF